MRPVGGRHPGRMPVRRAPATGDTTDGRAVYAGPTPTPAGCLLLLRRRNRSAKTLGVRPAPDTIRLRVLDARGVAPDADAEGSTEVESLFVRESELSRQLVDADLSRQLPSRFPSRLSASSGRTTTGPVGTRPILAHRRRAGRADGRRQPERPAQRPGPESSCEAVRIRHAILPTEPGSPARKLPADRPAGRADPPDSHERRDRT